jgi:hypothetical protein
MASRTQTGGEKSLNARARRAALALPCLACVLLVSVAAESRARQQPAAPARGDAARPERTRYRVTLALDFDARTFTGTSRVRWTNRDSRPASVVYFNLYANVRGDANGPTQQQPANASPAPDDDEPRVEVKAVRARPASSAAAAPQQFALEERATALRVSLREAVAPDSSVEIEIDFAGSVPELDADETSLPAHIIQQLGAALRDTREARGARDTNFLARGVMLLGASYPVLAVREGGEWRRGARAGVGDLIYAEAADYDVEVRVSRDVSVYSSGRAAGEETVFPPYPNMPTRRRFVGMNLRSFALVAGRNLQSAERTVGGVRVRSVFARDHEKTGRRVLDVAARAAEIYSSRFGPAPYPLMTISEAPLSAGVGSAEFTGLCAIASAYYVDFDSPTVRNLPELVREQRTSVEDSLEFAVAHMIAHQWWGGAVGSDPAREPVLDEALAHWSALVYYREAHGAERAEQASEDQLKGVYEIYRTFGGEDLPADREAREYRNSFQYAAVVAAKGALAFAALEKLLGAERVFKALRGYHEANRFEVAELDDLRAALVAEAALPERRDVTRTLARWLSQRHGDEDISPPNAQLAADLGLTVERGPAATPNPGNRFSRLGKFFWRQMTRIR